MFPFNLAALTRATTLIQRKTKYREFFAAKTPQNITQLSFINSIFSQTSCCISKLFSSTSALQYFNREAMDEMTPIFLLEENEEPMATEPIYLSSYEREDSTPNTTPDHHHGSIYPDSINQLIAAQLELGSNMGTETVFYPTNPNASMISDDEEQPNLTPIIGNPEQYTSQI